MQIHDISISLLREYDNNPRNNDGAVDAVAARSLRGRKRVTAYISILAQSESMERCTIIQRW